MRLDFEIVAYVVNNIFGLGYLQQELRTRTAVTRRTALNSDGSIICERRGSVLSIYKWSDDEGRYIEIQTFANGEDVSITANGMRLAFAFKTQPYFRVYDWDNVENKFILVDSKEGESAASNERRIAISEDGEVFLAGDYTAGTDVYKWNILTNEYDLIQSIIGTNYLGSLLISLDKKIVVVNQSSSYIHIYRWNDVMSEYELIQTISSSNYPYQHTGMSDDNSIFFRLSELFKWNASNETYEVIQTFGGYLGTMSKDGKDLFRGFYADGTGEPNTIHYKWDEDTEKFKEYKRYKLYSGSGRQDAREMAISRDKSVVLSTTYDPGTLGGSPRVSPASVKPTIFKELEFDTAPTFGENIVANFTVPYIPKTEDYVLDVEFTFQFNEDTPGD